MKKIFGIVLLALAVFASSACAAGEYNADSKPSTEFTKKVNEQVLLDLNFKNTDDFDNAQRGFISRDEGLVVFTPNGRIAWTMASYDFITPDCPPTVNPSLWRHARLNNIYGLFEVVPGIYQVRGYDLANITFVEAKNTFIAVDVLTSEETAAAAVKLFYNSIPIEKRNKKIGTIIYTHSHADHFSGIYGLLRSPYMAENYQIIAPDGFTEAAISENLTVGDGMRFRAMTMYGTLLTATGYIGERGHVDNGLGKNTANGSMGFVPPDMTISEDYQTMTIDGLEVEFIMAKETEAPSEMVFYFKDYKSICLAEICNRTFHNILTPRGAVVRDPLAWSDALDKMLARWGDEAESAWGPHTWAQWGSETIKNYIKKQSLAYRYVHDQAVFLINKGHGMVEIAENFRLPDSLGKEWFNRGYYGTLNFNVKAVFQKYLGWFDNNPATLWQLPRAESAKLYMKYVPAAQGDFLKAAQAAYNDGEYRWVVEILENIRLGDAGKKNSDALYLQADAFEQLAYIAESGIWRNYFLTGARRNREPKIAAALVRDVASLPPADTVKNFDTLQIFTLLSTQINGAAKGAEIDRKILWIVAENDRKRYFDMSLEASVLWTREIAEPREGGAKIALSREAIDKALGADINWISALLANAKSWNIILDGDAEKHLAEIAKLR